MKRVASCIIGLCGLVAWIAVVDTPRGADASSCYEIYGKVRNVGTGWAHIVYVENNCEDWLQCTVWTDVDPQPPAMMSVAPGMTENAQIAIKSEGDTFKSFGTCRNQ